MKDHYENTVDPSDVNDLDDPQLCAEYASEIFTFLRTIESTP